MTIPSLKETWGQIIKTILYVRQAPDFILENKLWRGYLSIGWISKLSVLTAVVFSYTFVKGIIGLFTSSDSPGSTVESSVSFMSELGSLGDKLILSGSMKYLILILLETMIFHFAVKTYEKLSGEKRELTVKDFIHAEIRMIKVSIRSWIYELIFSAIVMFILELFGFDVLSKVAFFLIQCYFLGLAFIDNYNEQFEIPIKESFKIAYQHMGAAVVVGIVAYVLFLIPLLGMIVAPFVCAVGMTTYMYYSEEYSVPEVA